MRESLDKYIELLSDISFTKVKIPGYIDERDAILSDAEKLTDEFKLIYNQLFQNLEMFINEPKKENVENIENVLNSGFDVNEFKSNVNENSENMIDQLDTMVKKVEGLRKTTNDRR